MKKLRLRWFGPVECKDDVCCVNCCEMLEIWAV